MLSMPFVYSGCMFVPVAVRTRTWVKTKRAEAWDEAIGSVLSFTMGSQSSLLTYCLGTFTRRRIVGFGWRLSEAPDAPANDLNAKAMRIVAMLYLVAVVGGLPTLIMTHLFALRKSNKLCTDYVLQRYGFLYAGYKANCLYWGVARLAKRFFLCIIGVALWKYPFTQAILAICVLITALSAQARVRPFLNDTQNWFEKTGLCTSIVISRVFFSK